MTWGCRHSLWSSQTMINYCISSRSVPFSCAIDYVSCSDSKVKLDVLAKISIILCANLQWVCMQHMHVCVCVCVCVYDPYCIWCESSEMYSGTAIFSFSCFLKVIDLYVWVFFPKDMLFSQQTFALHVLLEKHADRKIPEWKKKIPDLHFGLPLLHTTPTAT